MQSFGASAPLRLAELAAKWAGVLLVLLIATGDRGAVAPWAWPIAVALLAAGSVLLLARPRTARRLSGILDVVTVLVVSAATGSLAAHIAVFMVSVFWITTLPPRWSTGLTATLALGTVAIETQEGEELAVLAAEVLAVGLTGLWFTVLVAVVSRAWFAHQERLRQLEDSRSRVFDEAHAAEAHALLVVGADIHDGPLQLLLTAAQDLDETSDPAAAEAGSLVRRAIVDLRNVLAAAKPDNERQHVEMELGDWCVVLASRRRFTWSVDIDRQLERIDPIAVAATREFVTNAAKHSECTTLSASIRRDGDWVVVTVTDDGHQIPEGTLEGFGLTALRRRVEGAGGTLALGRRPGGGTAAVAQIPYRPDEQAVRAARRLTV